jgi:preprotein translocase subunit SecE
VPRNRKRAKERRARRPQPVPRADRDPNAASPLGHAAPDVELAEAQLAVGRPEFADGDQDAEPAFLSDEDLGGAIGDDGEGPPEGGGGTLVAAGGEPGRGGGAVAVAPISIIGRLVGFLQGSWRELQRVQWPDRRQVAQATGVVIGFVIVAGVWLGVADTLASKLVSYILHP